VGNPGDAVEHALEAIDQAPAPPEGAPGTDSPGRAGRNLPVATAVGLAMAALVLVPLFTVRAGFVVVVGIAACLGLYELSSALGTSGRRVPLPPLWVGSAIMVWLAWSKGSDDLVIAFLLTVIASAVWRLLEGADGYLRDVAATTFALVYVPLLISFAVLLAVPSDGARRVVAFVATVACSDIGGYAAGVLTGRHPMAPTISPKKSWEGFAGSVVACLLTAGLMVWLGTSFPWWSGLVIGALVVCTATGGDLVESMIKRDIGVKDMGNLLPGHGGIMDRLDSMLPSAMVCWLVFTLLT
jgi:phosphatidate cytidylyltransferase